MAAARMTRSRKMGSEGCACTMHQHLMSELSVLSSCLHCTNTAYKEGRVIMLNHTQIMSKYMLKDL